EARRAFLSDIDRSVPRSRQADHCIGCNECVSHCPPHIPRPVKMGELSRYTEYLRSNPD
ncbi:MAG: 4Fe-4S dicluster domain-containing protein, partial [Muribaculaceae bacterium]|nr:4Fe-4S dicluster domain-containing protein [Muribaculaceae bacterium]